MSCACAGNVFLWDRLIAATKDVPLPFLEDFVRAKPLHESAQPVGRARAASGRAAAPQQAADAAAAAAQLVSVRSAVVAAVVAIVGAEVCTSTVASQR